MRLSDPVRPPQLWLGDLYVVIAVLLGYGELGYHFSILNDLELIVLFDFLGRNIQSDGEVYYCFEFCD